jgi:CRISPR-associated endonuclease/helicase Cas3
MSDASGKEPKAKPRWAAHTPNDAGDWQSMTGHVLGGEGTPGVTPLAETFAAVFGAGEWGKWAGLLHDIGKYSDEFQDYLVACEEAKRNRKRPPRKGVDHKSAGAWMASRQIKNRPLAVAMLGHHGQIYSSADFDDKLAKTETRPELHQSLERGMAEIAELKSTSPQLPSWLPPKPSAKKEAELFLRMIYSCLVDADSIDTEAHFNADKSGMRGDATPLMRYRDLLHENQQSLMEDAKPADTEVNRVRREVYEACRNAAALPPGVFRLTVPTGGGKTRSSLTFALEHALLHGMDRIIYAIPYTSIIDQTVGVFRSIFGEGENAPRVLEHHSAVPEPERGEDEDSQGEDPALWRRLASENWDARLIVTTTVQLFESLFSHKPARCRKVHRLAKSVLILDEAQTLPLPLLKPIVDALKQLAAHYGMTVVLCTATQPALDNSPYLKGFDDVREIISPDDRNRHFRQLERVRYAVAPEPWTWERVADEMETSDQCLTVLNTRRDAIILLEILEERGVPGLVHLSTLLCGAHRRKIIKEVKTRLKQGEPVRLVSTQVVEAGVDLDFPKAMRAVGPLDRIIQAAGRCNREGLRDHGEVIVFFPAEGRTPKGPYAAAQGQAEIMLRQSADLHRPETIEAYFRALYGLGNLDEREIQPMREAWNFPLVAEKFRMIDEEDTVPILAPYDKALFDEVIEEARKREQMTRRLWRQAQPLTVSIFRKDFEARQAMIETVILDQLYVWRGTYDELRGLVGVARDPSDLIIDSRS